MKMFPRSFYFVLVLTAAILMTGCATQQQQQQAVQGAVVGAVIGGLIGAVSTNTRQQPQYQQPQHQQQRSHPGCHSGAQPYFLPDGRPGCMVQQQQQVHSPQSIDCSYFINGQRYNRPVIMSNPPRCQ